MEVNPADPRIYLLLPAYNPGAIVITVVRDALQYADHIILIDDGCSPAEKSYLQACLMDEKVTCYTHDTNQGKGFALCTGIQKCVEQMRPNDYILCMDSDGQHRAEDIVNFRHLLASQPDVQLALGERRESGAMPWKSRIGNAFARALFRFQYGSDVYDTQTGFRLLSRAFAETLLLRVKPGRYETEMNMLILASQTLPKIHSVTIPALYFENNKNSKFNPISDSWSVMQLFFKYALVSVASLGLDYFLFVGFLFWPGLPYLWANILARIISAVFNFMAHKEYSFQSKGRAYTRALQYLFAAVLSLSLSSIFLYLAVDRLQVSEFLAKPLVDVIVFILNFLILSRIVFSESKQELKAKV